VPGDEEDPLPQTTFDEATAPHEPPAAEPASRVVDDEPTGFEELDAPAPAGMLQDDDAELFPDQAPPVIYAADGEDTIDEPPATDDQTRPWDPFGDDKPSS
jgi:hypothetical protein